MKADVFSLILTCVVAAVLAAAAVLTGRGKLSPARALETLLLTVPFAFGGFYPYMAALAALYLLALLLLQTKNFRFRYNFELLAVLLLFACACLTLLWAADKGMAWAGALKLLPVALFAVLLLQLSQQERKDLLRFLPLTAAGMTVLCCGLRFLPGCADCVLVNSRLAGLFQYPNAFAAYLLAALAVQAAKEAHTAPDYVTDGILLFGILSSGSRAALLIAVIPVGYSFIRRHRVRELCVSAGVLAVCFLSYHFFSTLLGTDARYTTISVRSGTFLARLLYDKDALGLIATHPFGLGWWGYKAMLGSVQTARYEVSFVHCGILQLMLDYGWLPAVLLVIAACRSVFGKRTDAAQKLLLVTVLCHTMLDFDLQYLAIWLILLTALLPCEVKYRKGRSKPAKLLPLAACVAAALCLWLGTGDFLYELGQTKACLSVLPFHSESLQRKLTTLTDAKELDACAQKLLDLDPHCSLAWSAAANAAFAEGDFAQVMRCKQKAIENHRYGTEEYTDYAAKLFSAIELYQRSADTGSVTACIRELQAIPQQMAEVAAQTDPLSELTGEDSTLQLPQEYLDAIASLG